jgi:2-polyprenyl-6-methoxyphenol hydroxylase-like FAD-dependent oxidoreductase
VPQGGHLHALTARGREVLEGLFPGLTGELVARGAPLSDMRTRGRWFVRGGYYHRQPSAGGQESLMVSRALLEETVRVRVLGLPNVGAVERCDALGLYGDERRGRVTGVRVLRRRAGSAEEGVPADLVVDASGRGSRAPAWLEALGYPAPAEEGVRIGVGYASRFYRRTPADLGGDHSAVVFAEPGSRRAGVLMAQEEERWHVTLVGYLGEHPPTDERGFLEFARSLAAPDIYELLKDAEPLSDPVPLRFPASRRRRYERLARLPEGFLVTGDALCSFNPVYGQGMTVAALEAVALRECLQAGPGGLGRRFFRQAGKVVDAPWRTAVGGDLRFPEVEGKRTPMVRFVNWYLGRLHVAAHEDPAVAVAFQRVLNMLAPPPSVLRPKIVLRVLRGNVRPATRLAAGVRPLRTVFGVRTFCSATLQMGGHAPGSVAVVGPARRREVAPTRDLDQDCGGQHGGSQVQVARGTIRPTKRNQATSPASSRTKSPRIGSPR